MWTLAVIVTLSLRILSVWANVEKTIFLGPEAIQIPKAHPNLEDLRLESLTPSHWSLRRQVVASFPNSTNPKGSETWLLLDGLEYNQRYEVRICWAATQPTAFTLDTFTLPEVFNTSDLIFSLALYSESRQSITTDQQNSEDLDGPKTEDRSQSSILFLRVTAAASYFTTNKTLMRDVPLVNVDIILDPFLLNILPRSLLPTGIYLIILAVVAWYLSDFVWQGLYQIAQSGKDQETVHDSAAPVAQQKKKV